MCMKARRKFNPGDKIGGWTLLEYPYKSKKVLVRCDCGFEAWRWLSNFSAGKSMGCRQCMLVDPAAKTYAMVARLAQRRGLSFELTFDQWKIMSQQDCYYCDSQPSNLVVSYGYKYNGIDRVDSRLGYSLDNCVPACKICNRAKSDMPQDEFYGWVSRVYANS